MAEGRSAGSRRRGTNPLSLIVAAAAVIAALGVGWFVLGSGPGPETTEPAARAPAEKAEETTPAADAAGVEAGEAPAAPSGHRDGDAPAPAAPEPEPGPTRGPCEMLGGGNFDNGKSDDDAVRRYDALASLGLGGCRINVYPSVYLVNRDWDRPNVKVIDRCVELAHERGVRPVLLLEYYADFYQGEGLGTREQWRGLGRAFAERFRPGGTWAREHGVKDWGITVYSAFNEPERGFGTGGKLATELYVESLRGLAEGVHSVDPGLKVVPGGFMAANAWNDWTLRGLGPALAPLWNDGSLDGIDLHTYYDIQYAPMEKGYGDSAQSNFDDVKRASGVTADIAFYSTEFNYKKRLVTEDEAAPGFLTGIWDNLGVVKADGSTPATAIAFPWNIFHLTEKDKEYGLCTGLAPWEPTARGKVLALVAGLAKGMEFVSLDPRGTGVCVLEGRGRRLWVWQNRSGWTNAPGDSFTLSGIPEGVGGIEVYGWDGLRQTVETQGRASVTVTGLAREETHMFLARTD